MAFDPSTGELVLFGGSGGELADTWTYDGTTWTEQSPATSPPARSGASMAFDPSTGELVLFGGNGSGGELADTWAYDGTTWTEQSSATSPPARSGASMAFDPSTGELVLFGGNGSGGELADTWTYDGTTWAQQSPATSPPARADASMAFDPSTGELVLFGGDGSGGELADTWTYDGTTWAEQSPATSPPARADASMAFDPATGDLVLFGGDGGSYRDDTWTYDLPPGIALNWAEQSPATSPPARRDATMAFDPSTGDLVLFGGYDGSYGDDTWTYDGTTWTQRSPATSPPARYDAMMAFDPATGDLVLFGGLGSGATPLGDTWTYDGTTWAEQSPATSPPARFGATMDFDPSTGELVLFGGDGGSRRDDTWTYDGTTWTEQSPAASPPARRRATMAFDPSSGELVLFGGYSGSFRNDTWTYDGTTWTEQSPAISPPARSRSTLAFDPSTGNLVLFGGLSTDSTQYGDTWTYDGTTWTEQSPAASPPARDDATLAFDPSTGNLVLFGGYVSSYRADTWTYHAPFAPPTARINSPANHQTYLLDQVVETDFTCAKASDGPEIVSCLDSNGSESPGELDTSTGGSHSYVVTATAGDGQIGTASIEYTIAKATPTLTTQASPDTILGETVKDKATLAAGHSPGGQITFRLYGPDDTTCAGPPAFSEAVPVAGNGEYESTAFTPTAEGTYRWVASYSGDANNEAVSGSCNEAGESVVIGRITPTLTTQASPDTVLGETVKDSATLSGYSPSGQITFRLYGPDDTGCSEAPAFSKAVSVAGNGDYESTAFAPTAAGTYRWVASYSGDANNEAVSGSCSEAGESVVVAKATPTLTTVATSARIGSPINGATTVRGRVYPIAGGTLDFRLYDPSDTDCTGAPIFEEPNVPYPAAGGAVSSTAFAPTAAGTYRWVASYSGDANNEAVSGSCDEAGESVVSGGVTPTLTTQASPDITLGETVKDKATLSAAHSPGGQITFRLYGPDDTACSEAPVFSEAVSVAGNGDYESTAFAPTAAGTYRWVASYSGDANNEAVSGSCDEAGESVAVGKVTPTLTTQASPDITLGETVKDSATLSGHSPGGQITFRLYGPGDTTCSAAPVFSEAVPVAGNGEYEPTAFTPTAAGTYRWVASYSGDTNNEAVSGACDEAGESVVVGKATPTLTTVATSARIGSPIYGATTVRGRVYATAGGTLDFRLYAPSDTDCTGAPIFENPNAPYPTAGGAVSSTAFTPTATGTYRWVASYSGDANNEAVSGSCDEAGESVVVGKATPALTTQVSPAVVLREIVRDGTVCPANAIAVRALPYRPARDVRGKTAPGLRIRFRVGRPAKLKVRVRLIFRRHGKRHVAYLGLHRLRDHRVRGLRLALPAKLRSVIPVGKRVWLYVRVVATPVSSLSPCRAPQISSYRLWTRVASVRLGQQR